MLLRSFSCLLLCAASLLACSPGVVGDDRAAEADPVTDTAVTAEVDAVGFKQDIKPDSKADAKDVVTCNAWNTVIDGDFSPHEWDCAKPMTGMYSFLYVRLEGSNLHVLNDWHLRDDQPVSANMYNLFLFSTGNGAQTWDIRVYGDGHVTTLLNGKPYTAIAGAAGFHASPLVAEPHTIFEFSLAGVLPGNFAMSEKDPGKGSTIAGKSVGLDDPIAGSDDPDGALVAEPTGFVGTLSEDGTVVQEQVDGPVLVALTPTKVGPDAEVTVLAMHLGKTMGELDADAVAVKVLAWSDGGVTFLAPVKQGKLELVAWVDGKASNTLVLEVQGALPLDCVGLTLGRLCDDSLACTVDDACDAAAACVGKLNCAPGQSICEQAICGADGKCAINVLDGAPCSDGNACTLGDVCKGSACVPGNAVNCEDGNPCTLDSCKGSAGCVNAAQTGMACNDGNACTSGDACSSTAACLGKTPVPCGDGNACTADSCHPIQGCKSVPMPANTDCSDGDVCTKGDACGDGACKGKAPELPAAPPCWKSVCHPQTAAVTQIPLTGTGCGDGLECTKNDTCVGGKCVGQPILCDDGNPCTTDACNPGTGQCNVQLLADGVLCSDNDLCTVEDVCKAASCQGKVLKCDDGDAKTNDTCQSNLGCIFVPK